MSDAQIGVIASALRTSNGQIGPATLDGYSALAIDLNVTTVQGTNPTLQFFCERLGGDGVWYPVWSPAALTGIGQLSTSIGMGMATPQIIASQMRLRWVIGGTGTPGFTFSGSIIGR